MPTNEWQVRPLTKLDPDIQPEAWKQAVESANGKVPSHRIVKDVVQRMMERTQVPNTSQIGEVCQILVKDNPLTIYVVNEQGKKIRTSAIPITNDGTYSGYKEFLLILEMYLFRRQKAGGRRQKGTHV
ncbi:Site-specific DNA-cytosine methylase (plasmid) [Nostoc flagelliforme CCNUN1]|uniref:Site-specific DNA-cytosine methylase n=1 Tax=Nostoc flagelliforme CCNUN1 TaxID=2038116 RepID=A0A2K8T7F0_9NOSO|nr:Site-specific DNA-cytosine methylase [Nostoc flagelliforme CCNUN1]